MEVIVSAVLVFGRGKKNCSSKEAVIIIYHAVVGCCILIGRVAIYKRHGTCIESYLTLGRHSTVKKGKKAGSLCVT